MAPKTQATIAEINKWKHIELKSFCIAKIAIQNIKSNIQNERKYMKTTYLIS